MRRYRPSILLVADRADWAYDHIARFLMRTLGERYTFYRDYLYLHQQTYCAVRRTGLRMAWRHCKHCLRRRVLPRGQRYDLACYLGWYFAWCADLRVQARSVIQGIYTDGFPPQSGDLVLELDLDMDGFVSRYLAEADAIACGSPGIYQRYASHLPHAYLVPGGIDTDLFRPRRPIAHRDGPFTVGWTGDPTRAFKGFDDYVVPAVEMAARRRPAISLKTRFEGPLRTLPRFYDDVDVLLIASVGDAGPSAFLEAGACGVPSVATEMGLPAEFIRHGENGMFVSRSVEAMADALVYLHDHRDLLPAMGARIREDIVQSGSYVARGKLWQRMFDETLARAGVAVEAP